MPPLATARSLQLHFGPSGKLANSVSMTVASLRRKRPILELTRRRSEYVTLTQESSFFSALCTPLNVNSVHRMILGFTSGPRIAFTDIWIAPGTVAARVRRVPWSARWWRCLHRDFPLLFLVLPYLHWYGRGGRHRGWQDRILVLRTGLHVQDEPGGLCEADENKDRH